MSPVIEHLATVLGACSEDVGEEMGYYQLGHHSPWELRRYSEVESPYWGDPGWPRREWWQEMPYSLKYPDEPPCTGEESILYVTCAKDAVGAFPVTVLYIEEPVS